MAIEDVSDICEEEEKDKIHDNFYKLVNEDFEDFFT